jgi:drug/metabolite transporter (DMT)-like permease
VAFWSIGNLVVRDSSLTGPQIAFWRYLVAAAIYTGVHIRMIGPLRWNDFKKSAPTGIVIAAEIVAFFVAINHTTIANATVIGNMVPLLLFAVAARRFGESVPTQVVVATVAALGGVAAVVYGGPQDIGWNLKGDGLAVVAVFLFAGYFWLAKEARRTLHVFTLQTHSLIAGIPLLGLIFVVESKGLPVPSGQQWWSVVALVGIPGTGHLLMNWAHAHVSLTLASVLTLGVPVLSVVGAYFLFGEKLVWLQVAGLAVVLVVLAYAINETTQLQESANS